MPTPGLPAQVIGNITVDEGEHFPAALSPQHPGRAAEPGCFQVPQILMHRGRPWAHRPQQPVPAAHHAAGHAPAADSHLG